MDGAAELTAAINDGFDEAGWRTPYSRSPAGTRVRTLRADTVHFRGRGHESGLETELEVGWVWTVRDGRPTHARAYLELADALRAAGLNE